VEKKQQYISQIMTSKSPVRSCDDVDAEALSYAEIKALATGNPLIIEKAQLDSDVAKLKMSKADHKSQHYRLQDDLLQNFPKRIEAAKGHIEGFKVDMARLETNTHRTEEGISPMVIDGKTYTDRSEAGAALLDACQNIQTTEAVNVGSYRGFDLLISYDKRFNEFTCSMKGNMTHTATLGLDSSGNITRINNAFDKISERLASSEAQLQNLHEQMENTKIELQKPFAFEAELAEKSARLAELDSLLNIDGRTPPRTSEHGNVAHSGEVAAKTTPSNLSGKPTPKPSMLAALEKGAARSRAEFGGSPNGTKKEESSI
jgi:hypothetical protein